MRSLFRTTPVSLAPAALALASLVAAPAFAGGTSSRATQATAAQMCRTTCAAEAASRPGMPGRDAAAACTARCGAATAYLAQQNRRGTTEASGRGRVTPVAMPAPNPGQRGAALAPVGFGTPAPAARRPVTVIYAGRSPSPRYGLSVGLADRSAAHHTAQQACGDGNCRVIAEVPGSCGAVAQGIKRSQWALFITSDPASYVVTTTGAGGGGTRQEAERQAITDCRSRDPRATCRIAASTCGARG
jgi:hypothetical protein